MPTYQVVFTNGEKRELTVQAAAIDCKTPGMIILNEQGRPKAVLPAERVLYIVRVDED